ncbi:MAG: phosphoribosylanthranilate isomerase [Chloroflexi bacterium]|nr:phosphoribosylanthranilate isomerase [Chloroflexota bacterium]
MKIQIYTMQTPDEACVLAALGVDHLGVTPSDRGLPGEIDFTTARAICAAVIGRAVTVALSVERDPDLIAAMVDAVQPDVLHLCGLTGTFSPEQVRALRVRLPQVKIMQAISVAGPEAIPAALSYQDAADFLILDTQAAHIAGIGASGQTHDWTISREIVRQSRLPVILAGGLSPENVADAIRAVRPWGVDSLTHTNRLLPGGGFRKDQDRVRQFVETARGAE